MKKKLLINCSFYDDVSEREWDGYSVIIEVDEDFTGDLREKVIEKLMEIGFGYSKEYYNGQVNRVQKLYDQHSTMMQSVLSSDKDHEKWESQRAHLEHNLKVAKDTEHGIELKSFRSQIF